MAGGVGVGGPELRRWLAGTAAVVAGGAVVHALPVVTASGALRRRCWPRLAGVGAASRIALTFDDGPSRTSTTRFLRALERADVRATFFLLGTLLDRDPGLGREMAAAGHELAVHGWEHRNLLCRSPAATYADIARARDTVAAVTGASPLWYRPPYGVLTVSALLACRRLGLTPRLWTTWGRDWDATRSPAVIWETIVQDLDGGGTLLLHDSDHAASPGAWRGALAILPRLVSWAQERELTIGTLGAHEETEAAREPGAWRTPVRARPGHDDVPGG
ncbi:polysaccharide deacetylase family protein [Salinispora tropica]|uniref:Polysaccharide deacetylase n=1 Tax=Salinispora tropica (strain ATCC BAA-916 / DSM 44818 / JCM 13857 / NBRC 105044 / CNB-440) TaxID=369723 RepID=A4X2M4_SALTO|nr:polysaccharide deacetylase family protein [Salinispora tropica]ABP53124.1 polysaccharide deacetylase [Salinispora tropica CNB-440]